MSAYTDLTKLILWCRKNNVSWSALTCGSMTIEGQDMKVGDGLPKADTTLPRATIHQQYGAALLQEAADSEGMTSIVEED